MKKPTNLFTIILIALIFGAVAGALTSVATGSIIGKNLTDMLSSKEVDLANSVYDKASLVISMPKTWLSAKT